MRKLPNWIEGFMEYTENTVESPYLYRKWVAVGCVAAALQRKCYMDWGLTQIYPNMYIVLVGPSGRARKGSAMTPGYSMLYEIGIKCAAEAITREALIRELRDVSSTVIDPTTGKQSFHSSLTIYSQELTVFLGYKNLQLISDLTDWYDCRDRWIYRTKNSGTDDLIGVWINLIGATTPELIQTSMPRDAVGGGLTSRIIFVYEERKGKIIPAPLLGPFEKKMQKDLQVDLEQIHLMSGMFKMTEGFLRKYSDWYIAQENNPPFQDERFSGYFERRPTHIRKLAMIMSASRGDCRMIVTEEDFDSARELLDRTEIKMKHTLGGVGRSTLAELYPRIISFIEEAKETTMRDIISRFYCDASYEELDGIIRTIEMTGRITVVHSNTSTIIRHVGEDV